MSAWTDYNESVKSYTPDWMNTLNQTNSVGSTVKGAAKGALSGIPFGPIGMAAGTVIGAIGSGLSAIWQNKQARRQNQLMAEAFEYQKEQDELNRKERERERNINTIMMLRSNLRDAMYGHLTGRW